MKRVLWISRHEMSATQFDDLERVIGDQVCLVPWRDTVRDMSILVSAMEDVDAVAAVLPSQLLGELVQLARERPVLQSVAERRATGKMRLTTDGREEQEFAFEHRYWQQILRLELVTRRL